MSVWTSLKHSIRGIFHRDTASAELDEEVRHHIEELTSSLEATGLSPEKARRAARMQVGSPASVREEVQDAFWESALIGLAGDVRHALRRLARSPGFSVAAITMIALGVGGTSAFFAVTDSVLLRPLPYPESQNLIALVHTAPGINLPMVRMSPAFYYTYREEGRVFESISLWNGNRATVTGAGEAEEVPTLFVTPGFLQTLRVRPAIGRDFSASDADPRSPTTVILSDAYWRQHFGGSVAALDRLITVNGNPAQVIGVLPPHFEFMDEKISLVLPRRLQREQTQLFGFGDAGIARLRPGVTLDQANADMARCIRLAPAKFPLNPGVPSAAFTDAKIAPTSRYLKDELIGGIGNTLWLLLGAAGLLMLVAAANVANLLLVRADGRQRELAVRAALGAGWARLARELVLESALLGSLGALLGLALCATFVFWLPASGLTNLPRLAEISMSSSVLRFALAVASAMIGAVCVIQVWRHARPGTARNAHVPGRWATESKAGRKTQDLLVATQIALAVMLLVGAGLMMRTVAALKTVDPGFSQPELVQLVRVSIPPSLSPQLPGVLAMQEAIVRRFSAIPGVAAASIATAAPMEGGARNPVFVDGRAADEGSVPAVRGMRNISPGYAASIGSRIIAGHDLTWEAVHNGPPSALVSENLARELWGSPQDSLGKRIRQTALDDWAEVTGVVADLRDDGLRQPAPAMVYWPLLERSGDRFRVPRNVDFLIRSPRAGSEAFVRELREALRTVDPNVPLANIRTLQSIYRKSLAGVSLTMTLLAIAAVVALLLAIVGIYSVIAYLVSKRTREIGIRMALGSSSREVVRMFLQKGIVLAVIGAASGLAASAAASRMLGYLLFEVRAADPLTYAMSFVILLSSAALASWLPSRRAAAVNPVDTLRAE